VEIITERCSCSLFQC